MSGNFIKAHYYRMSGAMNRQLYSRINYVHSPDGELLRECPGITNDAHRV